MANIILRNTQIHEVGDFKMSIRKSDFGNWKICDGRDLTTEEYDIIMTDGLMGTWQTSFQHKRPDGRGRAIGAYGISSGGVERLPGEALGEDLTVMTMAQMPRHSHYVRVQKGAEVKDTAGWDDQADGREFLFAATDRTTDYGLHYRKSNDTGNPGMSYEGNNMPQNNLQPTIFLGNLFVYIG